ncbi:VapC toxin family PIN domain ribonuclease [Vandammella animalimorsus]|uniref:Ribonuclease VapC n=1 Tax=Vandammella animalimorsus TaxID=2029117 RepID=A0A2A2T4J6_9BURK|nr:PIN domain-containing protein [Vandammella animalimorsus]PAT31921.1 VapC toxin family PIN domain ribonuclease [Vandammella animalimorsus]PAX16434.1 VapC toxin family PIN domain ribonuclease [Vandammella animalimorsus]PAX18849.1 VapC toxin family PIN domain ribonuclease [Vandammella animalimorsus]
MIIADTGFFYALVDRRDAWHSRAVAALGTQAEGWVTTWPVLTEATHLLMRWIGPEAARALLDEVADGSIATWHWPAAQNARLSQLMARYQALPMDLADASLVLLAEHLGHGRILTTDERDFGAYRFKRQHPFENLLLERAHG